MTLRGHKNHYNVKLLRGYAASISLKKNKVCLKDLKDIFFGPEEASCRFFCSMLARDQLKTAGGEYYQHISIGFQLCQQNLPAGDKIEYEKVRSAGFEPRIAVVPPPTTTKLSLFCVAAPYAANLFYHGIILITTKKCKGGEGQSILPCCWFFLRE